MITFCTFEVKRNIRIFPQIKLNTATPKRVRYEGYKNKLLCFFVECLKPKTNTEDPVRKYISFCNEILLNTVKYISICHVNRRLCSRAHGLGLSDWLEENSYRLYRNQ